MNQKIVSSKSRQPNRNGNNRSNGNQNKEPKRQPSKANRNKQNKFSNKIDFTLLLIVVSLVLFGIIMVYSSSYYVAAIKLDDSTYYLRRQTMYALLGFVGMYIMAHFNFKLLYSKIPWVLYIGSLVLVIYAGFFGVSSNGASRWIMIGGFSLQPSELAKVAIILLIPYLISTKPYLLKSIGGHIQLMIPTGIMAIAVAKENLSTAIIIAVIGVGVLFLASPRTKEFILLGIGAVVSMFLYLFVASIVGDGFRGGRFKAWLHPFDYATGTGFQIIQSLYAVASGGFFGLGLGKSRQKLSFIPEAHNDIIFAIICEELGFFGAVIVLALFAFLIWRIFDIALKSKSLFPSLICSGVAIMIATQVIINVAVVTNTIPNTGIPMPFISSGGTALIVVLGLMGIVLNISRTVDV